MKLMQNLVIAGAVSMLTTLAAAQPKTAQIKLAKATPNCEVNNKKTHVRDQAACEKKKGKWLETGASSSASVKDAAPAKDAPAAAPAPEEKK